MLLTAAVTAVWTLLRFHLCQYLPNTSICAAASAAVVPLNYVFLSSWNTPPPPFPCYPYISCFRFAELQTARAFRPNYLLFYAP